MRLSIGCVVKAMTRRDALFHITRFFADVFLLLLFLTVTITTTIAIDKIVLLVTTVKFTRCEHESILCHIYQSLLSC